LIESNFDKEVTQRYKEFIMALPLWGIGGAALATFLSFLIILLIKRKEAAALM